MTVEFLHIREFALPPVKVQSCLFASKTRELLSEKRSNCTTQNICLVYEEPSTRDRDDDSRQNITDAKLLVTNKFRLADVCRSPGNNPFFESYRVRICIYANVHAAKERKVRERCV